MPRKKKIDSDKLKIEIEECLDALDVLPSDHLGIYQYTGHNAVEVMKFCGGYHMECTIDKLIIWKEGCLPMSIKPSQYIKKSDDGLLMVLDDV